MSDYEKIGLLIRVSEHENNYGITTSMTHQDGSVFLKRGVIDALKCKLSDSALNAALVLGQDVIPPFNMCMYKKTYIEKRDIQTILGLSRSHAFKITNELLHEKIISVINLTINGRIRKVVVFNPFIIIGGSSIKLGIVSLFYPIPT